MTPKDLLTFVTEEVPDMMSCLTTSRQRMLKVRLSCATTARCHLLVDARLSLVISVALTGILIVSTHLLPMLLIAIILAERSVTGFARCMPITRFARWKCLVLLTASSRGNEEYTCADLVVQRLLTLHSIVTSSTMV